MITAGKKARANLGPCHGGLVFNASRVRTTGEGVEDSGECFELARRLAEEFDTVPLPVVGRAVRAAARAVSTVGKSEARARAEIERLARAELASWAGTVAPASVVAG